MFKLIKKYKKLLLITILFSINTLFNFYRPTCIDNLDKFTQEKFIADLYSNELIIFYKDGKIKKSSTNDPKVLLSLVSQNNVKDAYVFDREVNKVSSFLYSKNKPLCLYTFSITKEAIKIFKKYDIKYIAENIVNKRKLIENEKIVKNIDDYNKAYNILLKHYKD